MNTERWRQLSALFDRAMELPTGEQDEWLRQACAADEDLRREVSAMLSVRDTEGILDRPFGLAAPLPLPEADGLAPGAWIGSYQVRRELDRGGMGVVYQAHDPRLDRLVALKCLAPRLQGNARAKAHFLAEARAAAGLDHPNICTVYELGEADGSLFIAMALYEGETLRRLLDTGPLPVERAVGLALQVARGLECAHQVGVVHRDIKPSNVIVTRRGEAKILDFGIAQLESDVPATGDHAGTPHYMSPEQAAPRPVDARTDLWALGVVLYEMLTGRRPFTGDQPQEVLRAIAGETPEPPSHLRRDVPAALDDIVARLLAKAPEERFQTAAETVAALAATGVPHVPRPQPGALRRIPAPLTSLVGRDRELAAVERLVRTNRLVTLTGPGGTGKTRLALAVADRVASTFGDGVALVPLASITDPTLLTSVIAEALEIRPDPRRSRAESLRSGLEHRRLLLVLDNFEQIASAAGDLVQLLADCPTVTALVTSRLALRVEGEQQYAVPPLALPDPGANDPEGVGRAPAVELFIERARAVDPDFAVTDENARSVAEVCARLDGLPLGIELAAASVKLLPPRAMLERLRGPLDVPPRGGRDRAARHRSLRAAIGWSYDLLPPDEQRVFRAFGVFVGGCSLESAEWVCGAVCPTASGDALATLLDHSLLQQGEMPDGTVRLTMLESIRAYALERVEAEGEADRAGRAHAQRYLALAEQAESLLTGPEQRAWLDRLQIEYDNLRAALAWAVRESEPELALRFGVALWRFWLARGRLQEGRAHMEALVAAAPGAPEPLRLRALNALATLLQSEGRPRAAFAVLEQAHALAVQRGLDGAIAAILNNMSWVSSELAELDAGERIGLEALAHNRRLDDRRGVALALNNLGWIAMYRGEMRRSLAQHAEGLDLRRAIGDERGVAFALANMTLAHAWLGEYGEAEACARQSLDLLAGLHDGVLIGWTQCVLGVTHWLQEQLGEARAALEASRLAGREGGNPSVLALGQICAGHLARAEGDFAAATAAFTESLRLHRHIEMPWGLAAALCGLGVVAYEVGDTEQALALLHESLGMRRRMGARLGIAECQQALALIAFDGGEHRRAEALWKEASGLRAALGIPLAPVERAALARLIEAPWAEPGATAQSSTS